MNEYGIDVASFNTITDWTAVRGAGNSWAWSKATQAGDYTNPLFAGQMGGGRSAGLAMGAYHFPDPRVSVATQVAFFVRTAKPQNAFASGAFLPMLDMEDSPAQGITWSAQGANSFITAFRDALRTATGVAELCVYASESWWAQGFLTPAAWADDHVYLCAAQYTRQPGQLDWSHPKLAVHQYTDNAPTPGAAGPTDRSVILGPYTCQQLTIGGAVSPLTRSSEEDDMGFWVKMTQTDAQGSHESSGYFEPASGDFLILPLPDAVRSANAFSDLNAGGASDADALGRWNALAGRWDRNRTAIASAMSDALKADGIGTGGTTNITAAFPTAWTSTDKGEGVREYKAETA